MCFGLFGGGEQQQQQPVAYNYYFPYAYGQQQQQYQQPAVSQGLYDVRDPSGFYNSNYQGSQNAAQGVSGGAGAESILGVSPSGGSGGGQITSTASDSNLGSVPGAAQVLGYGNYQENQAPVSTWS